MTGDDAEFTSRALALLPAVTVPPGFEAALLAAYGNRQARRPAVRRFGDLVWPGAPLWAPAGALAASLLLGVVLGTVLPAPGEDRMAFSLDQAPGFSLSAFDNEGDM